MALCGVVYTSRVSRPLSHGDIDGLLLDARANNEALKVTGVLLHGGNRFFQYIEGERDGVDEAYECIRRSSLHTELVELENGDISRKLFRHWFMGFRALPGSMLQQLSQADWEKEIPWALEQAMASAGIRQLMDFLGPVDASSAARLRKRSVG